MKLCECGCGKPASVARQTDTKFGYVKGQPKRFINGHQGRVSGRDYDTPPNPTGLCGCGCGSKAPIAKHTSGRLGHVKGQPVRYIQGHGTRGKSRPLAERFWENVDKNGPLPSAEAVATHPEIKSECCWIFGSSKRRYGHILYEGVAVPAHHAAWFLATGRWPKPQCLHKCDVPACVRFEHLFQGSKLDNMADMKAKERDRWVRDRNINAKLTDEQVAEIRNLGQPWARSGRRHRRRGLAKLVRDIAKRFGVHRDTIVWILSNKGWQGSHIR